jgi:Lipid A 3-O-deacylase (PagL)
VAEASSDTPPPATPSPDAPSSAQASSNQSPATPAPADPAAQSDIRERGQPATSKYRSRRNDGSADGGAVRGSNELHVWTGGGSTLPGGTRGIATWNAGVSFGRVLTSAHGPGFLRGRFEYAVDAIPVFVVFQPGGTAYGAGFDPLGLKWNFLTHGRFEPYADLSGGVLFTNRPVPSGVSRTNFLPSAAFGLHFLRGKYNWSAEVRYMHISDAGLTSRNPGINTVQVRLGWGFFTRQK